MGKLLLMVFTLCVSFGGAASDIYSRQGITVEKPEKFIWVGKSLSKKAVEDFTLKGVRLVTIALHKEPFDGWNTTAVIQLSKPSTKNLYGQVQVGLRKILEQNSVKDGKATFSSVPVEAEKFKVSGFDAIRFRLRHEFPPYDDEYLHVELHETIVIELDDYAILKVVVRGPGSEVDNVDLLSKVVRDSLEIDSAQIKQLLGLK